MRTLLLSLAIAATLLATRASAACPSPVADQSIKLPGHPFAAEPSADNCHVFVSLIGGRNVGTVAVLANEGGTFRLVRSVAMPRGSGGGLSLSHDGSLLSVAAEEAIVLLDVAKLETLDQEPVVTVLPDSGNGAIYSQFSRDDTRLFISEERNASILVVDVAAARRGANKVIVGRIPVGQAPVGLALLPDGTHLFSTSQVLGSSRDCNPEQNGDSAHAQGALVDIDVAKASVDPRHASGKVIRAGCNPVRVVISTDGHTAWVSQRGSGSVMGFDPSILLPGGAPGQTTVVAVGRSPVGLALRPDGRQLWVANSDRFASGDGSLALVTPADPIEARLSGTLNVGAFPRDLRFMPDGKTLVVAVFGDGAVMLHPTGSEPARK